MKELIVIDDTGSPGNASQSTMLKSDRYSLTAVLIHSSRIAILERKIRTIILDVQKKHPDVKELHFTDIINRRFAFSILSSEEVLGIFTTVTQLLAKEEFYIFHQTMTPRTFYENGMEEILPLIDPARKTIDYLTLDFLCTTRIKPFIESQKLENLFEIVIDEGIVKKGNKIPLPFLRSVMTDFPYASSESSENNVLLQIADFYAFVINRTQMLMIKEKVSDFDKSILKIIQPAFKNKGLSGITAQIVDPEQISKEKYDEEILKNFEKHGNLESWIKTNKKQ